MTLFAVANAGVTVLCTAQTTNFCLITRFLECCMPVSLAVAVPLHRGGQRKPQHGACTDGRQAALPHLHGTQRAGEGRLSLSCIPKNLPVQ